MTLLEDLEVQLQALDREEEHLGQQRAVVLRAYVRAAGGLNEAVRLLGMDKRALVRLQRLDELAMVVYRGPWIAYDDDGRPYGELGDADPDDQRTADSRWWRVAKAVQPRIKALVVVTAGTVTRIWRVQASTQWTEQDGKVTIPLQSDPLTHQEVTELFPELGLNVGDSRVMRRGLLREYLPLTTPLNPAAAESE